MSEQQDRTDELYWKVLLLANGVREEDNPSEEQLQNFFSKIRLKHTPVLPRPLGRSGADTSDSLGEYE